ncbi:MAG TPA: hypothetical protein VN089_27085 [Duganella sp.]|nr:hypothetical protein [Duganella sp.]
MKRLSILLAIAATLSACGGGGSGGAGSSAPATVVDNRPAVDVVPTVGDFYSYRQVPIFTTADGQPIPSQQEYALFYTDTAIKVGNDGSWAEMGTDSTPKYYTRAESRYRSDGTLTSTEGPGDCGTTFTTLAYLAPRDWKVGAEWNETYSRVDSGSCMFNPLSKSNKAVALETITVKAGTFNTIKIISTTSPITDRGMTVGREDTLWLDTLTHRRIKYISRIDEVSGNGSKSSSSVSGELFGYASAKQGSKNLNIERFAGHWRGSYSGTYSGDCDGEVNLTGQLDATCGDGLFSVHGDIDVNGRGTFYLTVNGVKGASFSGAFESPLSIGGAWSAGAASGTWKLEHQ